MQESLCAINLLDDVESPNFSMFICQACDLNHVQFTTANMAKIDFDVNKWNEIGRCSGRGGNMGLRSGIVNKHKEN